ncbi:hypothetical protein M0R45_015667 [Rubus argutus]|uniref:Uncharacterized protein n=1 Tax=Rubus argutus TaxID=59490 RepID=A0AAW1XTR9_RUBAR
MDSIKHVMKSINPSPICPARAHRRFVTIVFLGHHTAVPPYALPETADSSSPPLNSPSLPLVLSATDAHPRIAICPAMICSRP